MYIDKERSFLGLTETLFKEPLLINIYSPRAGCIVSLRSEQTGVKDCKYEVNRINSCHWRVIVSR